MLIVCRLRKVMENRKKSQMLQRDPRQNRYLSNSAPRGNQYLNYGSINISPTTVTDPDGPTPSVSSSRSGTTRCVCANPDSEGFMIQWYALCNVPNVANVPKGVGHSLTCTANLAIIGFMPSASTSIVGASHQFTSALSVPKPQICAVVVFESQSGNR